MPAIRLLGRKWLIASDDFVFSSIFELLFRFLSWVIVLILVVQIFYPVSLMCETGWHGGTFVRLYLCGILTLQAINIILLAVLAYQSSRGSIMKVQARRSVPSLLLLKLFLTIPDIVLNVMGTQWMFTETIHCPIDNKSPRILMQCIVIFYWLLVGFTVIGIFIVYDPHGNVSYEELQEIVKRVRLEKKWNLWSWRFQCAFCCLKRNEHGKEIFEDVAALFYNVFRTTDLVPSDVVAGIVLLGVRQKREQAPDLKRDLFAHNVYTLDSSQPRDTQTFPGQWMNLQYALHYLKLCEASYGCLFAMYKDLLTGPCNLMRHLTCCCCQGNPRVSGDNCCMCNYAGVKLLSKYPEENILFASFDNDVFENGLRIWKPEEAFKHYADNSVPFVVLLDRERMEIIVAVRGTLSFHDIFTDCTAWSAKFEADDIELPENTTAHKGFSMSAAKLLERLLPVLEEAYQRYPNYGLVITGHSLGAGVSVLLGIKLRAKYPHIRVLAFSTPASLISREAAKYTETFVMTVGLGDDVVMRLGVHSIETFKKKILEAIYTSKIPKYRILMSGFGHALFGVPMQNLDSTWEEVDEDVERHENGSLVTYRILMSGFRYSLFGVPMQNLDSTWEEVDEDVERHENGSLVTTATECTTMPRLYPAGWILHIAKPKESENGSRAQGPTYEIRWTSPEDYVEVQVSPRMLLDHMPDNVVKAIETVLEEKDSYDDSYPIKHNI